MHGAVRPTARQQCTAWLSPGSEGGSAGRRAHNLWRADQTRNGTPSPHPQQSIYSHVDLVIGHGIRGHGADPVACCLKVVCRHPGSGAYEVVMREAATRREIRQFGMTREEFDIVREAAARQHDAPPDLDEYIWLTWSRERGQPLRTWLAAIGVLQKIDRSHVLPFPAPHKTIYGWDQRFRVVWYSVSRVGAS